jgi:hypothetical protein
MLYDIHVRSGMLALHLINMMCVYVPCIRPHVSDAFVVLVHRTLATNVSPCQSGAPAESRSLSTTAALLRNKKRPGGRTANHSMSHWAMSDIHVLLLDDFAFFLFLLFVRFERELIARKVREGPVHVRQATGCEFDGARQRGRCVRTADPQ